MMRDGPAPMSRAAWAKSSSRRARTFGLLGSDPAWAFGVRPRSAPFGECQGNEPMRAMSASLTKGPPACSIPFSPPRASGVQLHRRRARPSGVASPSKSMTVSTNCERSTLSKVLTLITAWRVPSIVEVTIGITPQALQTWKSAVWEAFGVRPLCRLVGRCRRQGDLTSPHRNAPGRQAPHSTSSTEPGNP